MMIAVVDYGMGNLRSVVNAFEAIGEKVKVTQSPADLEDASGIVLPGVGAFEKGMENLKKLDLVDPLKQAVIDKKKPYLGICLGMQFLAVYSKEGFEQGNDFCEGLGWLKAKVLRIDSSDKKRFKVPHMGWNNLSLLENSGDLFRSLTEEPVFYFVHSYHLETFEDSKTITSYVKHGKLFVASVQKDNIYGVQFHPEKSQKVGLQLLQNFVSVVKDYAEKTTHSCLNPS